MSDCDWLSDRMPAVALGRSMWTAEEATHLRDCRSCQDEWDLIRLSSQLGKDVGAGIDPAATTRAVLHRLKRSREEAHLRRKAWGFAALASAAAAAAPSPRIRQEHRWLPTSRSSSPSWTTCSRQS
jgi:hypothetical protein